MTRDGLKRIISEAYRRYDPATLLDIVEHYIKPEHHDIIIDMLAQCEHERISDPLSVLFVDELKADRPNLSRESKTKVYKTRYLKLQMPGWDARRKQKDPQGFKAAYARAYYHQVTKRRGGAS